MARNTKQARERRGRLEEARWRKIRAFVLPALAAILVAGSAAASTLRAEGEELAIVARSFAPDSEVPVNAELSVTFTHPIDLDSVDATSFRVTEVATGRAATGTYRIDPRDPNTVSFRPLLTFAPSGRAEFGLVSGASYRISIGGAGDAAGTIRSLSGVTNATDLSCIVTAKGIADHAVGAPRVRVAVRDATGAWVPADGAANVDATAPIRFVFDDVMDPTTLLDPANPLAPSPSIRVAIDRDGDLTDASDRFAWPGELSYAIDLDAASTTVLFRPSGLAGIAREEARAVYAVTRSAVNLSGSSSATPAAGSFTLGDLRPVPASIDEAFADTTYLDVGNSGAGMWGIFGSVGSMLTPGIGGGSGRLGALEVPTGQTRTLVTGPVPATGTIWFFGLPCDQETFRFDGIDYAFCSDVAQGPPGHVPVQIAQDSVYGISGDALALTANNLVAALAQNSASAVDFETRTPTLSFAWAEVVARASTPGAGGNAIEMGGPGGSLTSDTSLCANAQGPALATTGLFLTGGLDGETFPAGSLIDNTDHAAGQTSSDLVVDDGVFEFSSIKIQPGGRLVLRGPNPARLFARGEFSVCTGGLVDLSGASVVEHHGSWADGEPGGMGGPGAGRGGRGADRPDDTGSTLVSDLKGGIENPGASLNGARGEGLAGSSDAEGSGGVRWPLSFPSEVSVLGGLDANFVFCKVFMTPGPGSGGAYAVDGQAGFVDFPLADVDGDGVPETVLPTTGSGFSNAPDLNMDGTIEQTPGGDSAEAGIEPVGAPLDVRLLDPDSGDLRGGSGGGGGGASCYGSQVLDTNFNNVCNDIFDVIFELYTSSGAGGGGGGGAAQLHAGATLAIEGFVDASGGDGGDGYVDDADPALGPFQATAGGGGSGGAVLAQGRFVDIAPGGPRLSVAGGAGGNGIQSSRGGDGGAGLIRVEDLAGTVAQSPIAQVVLPFPDPVNPSQYPDSESILSVGPFGFGPVFSSHPAAFSGAQSCWRSIGGAPLEFLADQPGNGAFGWTLDLVVNLGTGAEVVSYRDPAKNGGFPPLMGMSWQQFWGDQIDDGQVGSPAPLIVRFQGARRAVPGSDPCDAPVEHLTPWVRHPAELNAFSPTPNLVRFVIVFDGLHPQNQLIGVTNLSIRLKP